MMRGSAGRIVLGCALFGLSVRGVARAQTALPTADAVRSLSGQFVIERREAPPALSTLTARQSLSNDRRNVELETALLPVSCERIKQALYGQLGVATAPWQGHIYDISIGPNRTDMVRDGKLRFHADAGVVVRSYAASPARLSLHVKSDRDFRLTTSEFDAGPLKATIDGQPAGLIKVANGAADLAVPRGEHEIEVTRF